MGLLRPLAAGIALLAPVLYGGTAALAESARACVEHYDPAVDYFPVKTTLTHADGFKLDYFKHYKVLTVTRPWPDATETFRYVLVLCGTPTPPGFADTPVIKVPARRVAALSMTHLAHLDVLGALDTLVALGSLDRVYAPAVRRKIAAGELVAVGWGTTINSERLLQLAPDLVMATGYREPQFNAHEVLKRSGIHVVINSEYAEPSVLGQAEWLKFTAAFFNQEARAQALFAAIIERYEQYATLARAIGDERRPTMFTGAVHGGIWYAPGGKGYLAQLARAAGGRYLWADNAAAGNQYLDFETVFATAWQADVWLTARHQWRSRADMTADDSRYATFKAYQAGRVYNNNARVTDDGGNDYWETGVLEPDQILADLITVLHPDRLPGRELKYFRRLP